MLDVHNSMLRMPDGPQISTSGKKEETVLTLAHQDGDTQYELEKDGFVVVDSKLYVSIATKAIEPLFKQPPGYRQRFDRIISALISQKPRKTPLVRLKH